MERLTIDEVIANCKRHTERMENHSGRMQLEETPIGNSNIMKQYWEHRQTAEWLEQLKDYKNAEEQGLLLWLHCMVGDTLYYVDDIRKFVDECKVTKLEFRTMNKYHMRISIEMQGKLWHCIVDELIGEVAFFDKEEAEQALKRMESE